MNHHAISRYLLLAVSLAGVSAACGPSAPAPVAPIAPPTSTATATPTASAAPNASAAPTPTAAAPTATAAPPPPKMLPVTRTEFADRLKAIGVDVRNLPPLAKMDPQKLRLAMDYVAEATGADCTDCHKSEDDLKAKTPRKAVAMHMWNDWSRELTTADGGPVFCDSCHHGSLKILDRRDTEKIAEFMKANMVGKLVRKDKKKESCATCHGEPFNNEFLEKWEKEGH